MFPPKLVNGLGQYWLILFINYSYLFTYFFINPTIKTTIITFPFNRQFVTFLVFAIFFIKASSNRFTTGVANNISPGNCIFNFAKNKNFFWLVSSVSFSKDAFVFWYSGTITNFKFRIFIVRIFIVFSIRIRCYLSGFHFYCSVNCAVVFINTIV